MDWFDDAGWKEIQEHCRLLARLAHQGGLKGLLFDPEPYTEPFKQFKYSSQARRTEHSFEDYCRKARQRGREVMDAVASEFPDLVLFTYFLFGECSRALGEGGDPQLELAGHGYGLLPAFANGWLDRLPPVVNVIDGNEGAYRYNSEARFNAAFVQAVKAEPGQRYILCAKVRQSGAGIAWLTARWQTPQEKWTAEDRDRRFSVPAPNGDFVVGRGRRQCHCAGRRRTAGGAGRGQRAAEPE